jgi:hypothetical protein
MSPREFLDASAVIPRSNSDFLEFHVRAGTRALAVRLATKYAQSFTNFGWELDARPIHRGLTELKNELNELERTGKRGSSLYSSLLQKERELRVLLPLQSRRALVVRPSDRAEQIQPRPVRNILFGLIAGFVFGIGLVFLREAFPRIRAKKLGVVLTDAGGKGSVGARGKDQHGYHYASHDTGEGSEEWQRPRPSGGRGRTAP